MCGIVGYWNKNNQPVSDQLLIRMREMMYSRGPDDAGIWINGPIGLGHRRLSIIDLSDLGHQPMIDEETGSVIIYNGEVYNFKEIRAQLELDGIRFRSHSDTEVILKAYKKWGCACVKNFIGMFAFAIWDQRLQKLFIARDRMGIKPLYYYSSEKTFIFASRLGALAIHPFCPEGVDLEAVGLYLDIGFIPAPWSILQGVRKLKPGHYLLVDEEGVKEDCYWSLDNIQIDSSLKRASEEEVVDRLDSLLNDSIKLRLISDVPLGAFLSGGIDSSLMVSIMSRYSSSPVKAFTIGFSEGKYDESGYAKEIAQYLRIRHNIRIMRSNDLLSLLDDNALYYDEPFADCSSLPTIMVSRFAREQVTVSLSGDGGDELFAGYPHYFALFFLQYFYKVPPSVRRLISILASKADNHHFSILSQCFNQDNLLDCFSYLRSIIKNFNRQSIFSSNVLHIGELFRMRSAGFPPLDEISRASRIDAAYYLADDILQKLDVASMSTSLEARVPILDHRIVEFAQALPLKFKLRYGKSKWILKKILVKYLPENLFNRPKRGFLVPIDRWFRGELKEMIQDELSFSRIKQFSFLSPAGVEKVLNLHLSGKRNTHPFLWAILNLLRWKENFYTFRK